MTLRTQTSLINILLTGLLFVSSPAYAQPDSSLIQSYNLLFQDNLENESIESSTDLELQDMLFEISLAEYLHYNLGVTRAAGIKVYSSVQVKMRSEITYLQFKMTF